MVESKIELSLQSFDLIWPARAKNLLLAGCRQQCSSFFVLAVHCQDLCLATIVSRSGSLQALANGLSYKELFQQIFSAPSTTPSRSLAQGLASHCWRSCGQRSELRVDLKTHISPCAALLVIHKSLECLLLLPELILDAIDHIVALGASLI